MKKIDIALELLDLYVQYCKDYSTDEISVIDREDRLQKSVFELFSNVIGELPYDQGHGYFPLTDLLIEKYGFDKISREEAKKYILHFWENRPDIN